MPRQSAAARASQPAAAGAAKSTAPAVTAAVAILEYLRERAPTRLTASEIARAVNTSKATCHRILQTLATAGYVIRNPIDLSFCLGSALIPLGAAAAGDSHLVETARSLIVDLASRTGLLATAWRLMPDARFALLGQAAGAGPFQVSYSPGHSFPLTPPMGLIELAWAEQREVDYWLDTAEAGGFGLLPAERESLPRDITRVRRLGYSWAIAVTKADERSLQELADWLHRAIEIGLADLTPDEERAYVERMHRFAKLRSLGAPEAQQLSMPTIGVSVPAFDRDGHVALHISVVGFPDQISPEDVKNLVREVRVTADTITRATGGQVRHF